MILFLIFLLPFLCDPSPNSFSIAVQWETIHLKGGDAALPPWEDHPRHIKVKQLLQISPFGARCSQRWWRSSFKHAWRKWITWVHSSQTSGLVMALKIPCSTCQERDWGSVTLIVLDLLVALEQLMGWACGLYISMVLLYLQGQFLKVVIRDHCSVPWELPCGVLQRPTFPPASHFSPRCCKQDFPSSLA